MSKKRRERQAKLDQHKIEGTYKPRVIESKTVLEQAAKDANNVSRRGVKRGVL